MFFLKNIMTKFILFREEKIRLVSFKKVRIKHIIVLSMHNKKISMMFFTFIVCLKYSCIPLAMILFVSAIHLQELKKARTNYIGMKCTKLSMNFIGGIPRPLTCLSICVFGLKILCPVAKAVVSKKLCYFMMSFYFIQITGVIIC